MPYLNGNGSNGLSLNGNGSDGGLIDPHKRGQHLQDRGDDQLAKFLVMQQLFGEEEVNRGLETVNTVNRDLGGQALASSLLEKICGDNGDKLDIALSQLIDRTKFAYVPLEYYDVDRQVARMLPDHLTVGRLFVPFDLISRTIMVACCNPFDAAGREAVQQSLDYTVSWYLARPAAIVTGAPGYLPAGEPRLGHEHQIFRRAHRRRPDRGRTAPAKPAGRRRWTIQKKQGGRLLKMLTDKQYVTEQDMVISMGRCLTRRRSISRRCGSRRRCRTCVPREMARQYKLVADRAAWITSSSWRWPTR